MKKIIKTILSFSIAVLVIKNVQVSKVSAYDVERWGDFNYIVENNNAIITDYLITEGDVIIPKEINGYRVTGIVTGRVLGRQKITSITIPDSIEMIGYGAFSRCGVTAVTIPKSVTSIGDCAFERCRSLTEITIPESVTEIGEKAFDTCTELKTANVLSSVVGKEMFFVCSNLTTVTLNENITYIGEKAFAGCKSLTEIKIPESVTAIGKIAFANTGLRTVNIPESVESIGYGAFAGCDNLTTVIFNNPNTTFEENYGEYNPYLENSSTFNNTELTSMYAFKGSQAQSYSLNNNLEFVPIANVEINGERVKSDIPAVIKNNRVLIPMRAIFEKFGAEVDWNGETRTVTAAAGDKMIVMQIGEEEIGVNGEIKEIDVAPQMLMNRTIVPARAVSESLGAAVQWDEARQTVVINY